MAPLLPLVRHRLAAMRGKRGPGERERERAREREREREGEKGEENALFK